MTTPNPDSFALVLLQASLLNILEKADRPLSADEITTAFNGIHDELAWAVDEVGVVLLAMASAEVLQAVPVVAGVEQWTISDRAAPIWRAAAQQRLLKASERVN